EALVSDGELSARWELAGGEDEVDVAARDGERADEGLAVALEPRLRHVPPFDGVRSRARELSHGGSYPPAPSRRKRLFGTPGCVSRNRSVSSWGPRPASRRAPA